jgi:hypothetical protein
MTNPEDTHPSPEEHGQPTTQSLEAIEDRMMDLRHKAELTPEEESEIIGLRECYNELLISHLNDQES